MIGPKAYPEPNPALSMPLSRLFAWSMSHMGCASTVAAIISGILGIVKKPMLKPVTARPITIDVKLYSMNKGPIIKLKKPKINKPNIMITRFSTHLGKMYGIASVHIVYMMGLIPNMMP